MAGKVKASPISYRELNVLLFYANALAPGGLPQADVLRLRILQALMQRIKKFHPDEYGHCLSAISCIAKCEAVPDRLLNTPDEKENEIRHYLASLATESASRSKHNKLGIQLQQTGLRDCFTEEQYLNKITPGTRLAWFRTQWDQLMAIIAHIPCPCQDYRTSFDKFRDAAEERPNDLATIRNATDFLLAFAHNRPTVSAVSLQKALKSTSRS